MANPITNKVKTGKIPVIKKELDSGVIAEANNDGTIYLDKSVKNDSPLAKEAIAHEMVHMDQMSRGDLNYNDDKVFWKGKQYDRDDMNEGSKNLPWEKEAYNKTKDMKKSPNKYKLGSAAIRTNRDVVTTKLRADADKTAAIGNAVGQVTSKIPTFDEYENQKDDGTEVDATEQVEDSGADMNKKNKNKSAMKMKSTPITMKAKSPAKVIGAVVAAAAPALIKGAASAIGKKAGESAMKMVSPLKETVTSETKEFDATVDGQVGKVKETATTTKSKEKKESVKNFATACYNEDGSKKAEGTVVDGILCSWAKDEDFDPESEYEEKEDTIYDSAFTPETEEIKTPGKPGKANMGYYESLDSKMGAGVRGRSNKRVNRKAQGAGNKFTRMSERGKTPINPKTGEAYSREDYIKNVAGAFEIPDAFVGKREASTPGKNEIKNKEGVTTHILNKDTGKYDPVTKMNNNKNKSAFKMKGWNAYKN